jgi:cytidyltransferase-like protein
MSTRLVATIGCFDMLHPGHLAFLEAARDEGTGLVVGIPNDDLYMALKGRLPVMDERERAAMLTALRIVDGVSILNSLDYAAWLRKVEPDVLALSQEHRAERFRLAVIAVEEMGGKVVRFPRSPLCSISAIIRRIKEIYG